MKVGVPKEVKNHEYRVALTPVGAHELAQHGHEVARTHPEIGESPSGEPTQRVTLPVRKLAPGEP